MTQRKPADIALRSAAVFQSAVPWLFGVSAILCIANMLLLAAGHGMSDLAIPQGLVPQALLDREQLVLADHAGLRILFATSISLAFPAALWTFSRHLKAGDQSTHITARLTPVLALVAGISAIALGWLIGLAPDSRLLSGGTPYMVNGVVITAFSLMLLAAQLKRRPALAKEALAFLLALLPFPALFHLTLHVVGRIDLPAVYVAAGQGYVIPVGFSSGLLFLALFYVIHGQATREHN